MEFEVDAAKWTANFQPGLGSLDLATAHPNGHDAVVIANGDLWVVNPESRSAEQVLPAIDAALDVQNPAGWIFSRQGLALARFGPDGLIWHTRRLSWDGFDQLKIVHNEVTGLAWSPLDDKWYPFTVDLRTGRSTGGSYSIQDIQDSEDWERLADIA